MKSQFANSVLIAFLMMGVFAPLSSADEIRLENGFVLRGDSKLIRSIDQYIVNTNQRNIGDPRKEGEFRYNPIIQVDDQIRTYYISDDLLAVDGRTVKSDLLSAFDIFKIPQVKSGRKSIPLKLLQGVGKITPFDELGQREVTIHTSRGNILVIQGITFLHPRYVKVQGLNYEWDVTLSTDSIPPAILHKLLLSSADIDDPKMQRSIARFYIQADKTYEAYQFLDELTEKYATDGKEYEDVRLEIREQLALKLFNEIQTRRQLGQYDLAYESAQALPRNDIAPEVLFEIDKFIKQYATDLERLDSTPLILAELQSQLANHEEDPKLNLIRRIVSEELSQASLPRLNSFFELEKDATLTAEERLALAYSGWILGAEAAVDDLQLTLNLWQARFLVYDFLRSREHDAQLVNQIKSIESLNAERLTALLQNLPPVPSDTPITGGTQVDLTLRDHQDNEMKYSVLPPLEYSPFRQYPVLLALPPTGIDPQTFLEWWGGTAEETGETLRRGYLLVVPQFQVTQGLRYNHNLLELKRIHQALMEVRRQFSVNSDKVFIAGIGDGGDAAIDAGILHPDLFAGVISIRGRHAEDALHYWQNGKRLPWYLVGGEYDGRHSALLNKMFQGNSDLIYAQYPNRVSEWYREEQVQLFDWMALQNRNLDQLEIEYEAFVPQDEVKVDWIECRGLEVQLARLSSRRRTVPLEAKLTSHKGDSTTLQVTKTLGSGHTFYISPQLHDFNQQLILKVKGSQKLKELIEPDIEVILDDYRTRYDRQQIYWAKFEF
ncbi:hypothetical protein Pla110_28600 [Polystyrenella longa]|uniref:Alpha/beta hydrolase family protein n=1 Tax=Polystyrenella longa TaxID=2528007 RepID=A0A518CPI2_9PLAN|nr:hypothetical protein [Polystyrenella longa]QDU81123.1 hypothetical protein Pla110_28600 [Polystyrenella longa]